MVKASERARWTLVGTAVGSVLLVGLTALLLRPDREPPTEAALEPWLPPSAAAPLFPLMPAEPATRPSLAPSDVVPATTIPADPPPATVTHRPTTRPPATRPPATRPPATTRPPQSFGPNLSLRGDGDADGSAKAPGSRFNNVRDGDRGTFWTPTWSSGEISVKWPVPVRVARIVIREASGGGRIGAWQVRNHDNNAVLASGSGAGVIRFRAVALRKVTFVIFNASGAPRVAEYETFGS